MLNERKKNNVNKETKNLPAAAIDGVRKEKERLTAAAMLESVQRSNYYVNSKLQPEYLFIVWLLC